MPTRNPNGKLPVIPTTVKLTVILNNEANKPTEFPFNVTLAEVLKQLYGQYEGYRSDATIGYERGRLDIKIGTEMIKKNPNEIHFQGDATVYLYLFDAGEE